MGFSINQAELLIDKLFTYFNVATITELNEIFGDFNSNIAQNRFIDTQQIKEISSSTDEIINTDEPTFLLFKEAYLKAKENRKIKEFRIYLMEYK